ncbi:exostosin-1b-like [Mytilus galloprovincialis]|uniref:exostosin-1b-like n=1 Tax=Mytilus galloprovincialis TaxID=29158 RepID=UPI003F7C9878
MQAKKRYFLSILLGIIICLLCFLGTKLHKNSHHGRIFQRNLYSFFDIEDEIFEEDLHLSSKQRRETASESKKQRCRMETCFDFNKCKLGFKVYIYPIQERVSETYSKILRTIQNSIYYTSDPEQACVFILSIDTLDRDTLSKDYAKDIQSKLDQLSLWNNGKNHIVLNLYSGTWPNYIESLDFDIGEAMIAKASLSVFKFRPGFDISFPLFAKELPEIGGERAYVYNSINNIPPFREYLLGFKGKRYLTGIGSETRNSLYHIHNKEDIILLTTCRHGKNWQKKARELNDTRCKVDNEEYDKYDYKKLLYNATFCLVPRGRRLGSFRFLEALQAGCIPVLLSNGWELPFSEVIDWSKAAVWGDERLLFQVPSIVRSLSVPEILALKQQTQFLWETYFSSVDKIVNTVLQVVKDRVNRHLARSLAVWNSFPGALSVLQEYSTSKTQFPFYYSDNGTSPGHQFTAIIYATSPVMLSSAPLFRLIRTVAKSSYVHKMIVVWHCDIAPPPAQKWPGNLGVPVLVKTRNIKSISDRFQAFPDVQTDAVFSLDEDALITTDEIDFAFGVWREFPDRIVGYPAREHFYDTTKKRWSYTSTYSNEYSMILTGAAVYHRYYNYLYTNSLSTVFTQIVDQSQNCEDILMNFLVSHVTKQPPIKVTHRKIYKESMLGSSGRTRTSFSLDQQHFSQRQACLAHFVQLFGYMPLIRSKVRMDPVLFKDPVSNLRKKFRQIEVI